jgi:hypothetical protein
MIEQRLISTITRNHVAQAWRRDMSQFIGQPAAELIRVLGTNLHEAEPRKEND